MSRKKKIWRILHDIFVRVQQEQQQGVWTAIVLEEAEAAVCPQLIAI